MLSERKLKNRLVGTICILFLVVAIAVIVIKFIKLNELKKLSTDIIDNDGSYVEENVSRSVEE